MEADDCSHERDVRNGHGPPRAAFRLCHLGRLHARDGHHHRQSLPTDVEHHRAEHAQDDQITAAGVDDQSTARPTTIEPPQRARSGEHEGQLAEDRPRVHQVCRCRTDDNHQCQRHHAADPSRRQGVEAQQEPGETCHRHVCQPVPVESPQPDEWGQHERPDPWIGVRAEPRPSGVVDVEPVLDQNPGHVAVDQRPGLTGVQREVITPPDAAVGPHGEQGDEDEHDGERDVPPPSPTSSHSPPLCARRGRPGSRLAIDAPRPRDRRDQCPSNTNRPSRGQNIAITYCCFATCQTSRA